jgi:hypothetical protein
MASFVGLCSKRSNRSTPFLIFPRAAGEERDRGLIALNYLNVLNTRESLPSDSLKEPFLVQLIKDAFIEVFVQTGF